MVKAQNSQRGQQNLRSLWLQLWIASEGDANSGGSLNWKWLEPFAVLTNSQLCGWPVVCRGFRQACIHTVSRILGLEKLSRRKTRDVRKQGSFLRDLRREKGLSVSLGTFLGHKGRNVGGYDTKFPSHAATFTSCPLNSLCSSFHSHVIDASFTPLA